MPHLKTMDLPIFKPTVFKVSNYWHKNMLLGADRCHETPINSIHHNSKTILNWLKQLAKVHANM